MRPLSLLVRSTALPGALAKPLCYKRVTSEPPCTGCSHLLEYMAFKTTTHRTHFRLVREVSNLADA